MAADIGPKIGIDGEAKFKASIANINSALKAMTAAQKALVASFDESTSAETKQSAWMERLTNDADTLKTAQLQLWSAIMRAKEAYGENSTEANKLQAKYYEVTARLEETEKGLNGLNDELEESTEAFEEAEESASSFGDVLASDLIASRVLEAFKSLARGIEDVAESSISFESAFAGVEKTVDGTAEQMDTLRAGIKELSTEIPATAEEIAAVAEIAGQLGIATDNVLEFSRVMINLGESTSISAEEAATTLAQFMNVAGTAPGDVERLGSAIVALGNNFATNETKIVEMAQRLASAGTMAGFSEAEILALATAMSSVGIEAEAGGTAMTQTFTAITKAVSAGGDKLETFAKISGMTASEFSTAWKTDAAGALNAFINGLAKLNATGGDVTAVLDELGMSGVRQSNMLRSLTLASDKFNAAIEVSNAAWSQNTALMEEASKRYATTESRLQMAANSFENLKAAIGDSFTPQIGALADAGNELAQGLTKIAENAPGVASGFVSITAAVGTATAGLIAFNTAKKAISFIGIEKEVLLAAGPWVALAAGIGLLINTLVEGSAAFDNFVNEMTPVGMTAEETAAQLEEVNAEIQQIEENERLYATGETASAHYDALRVSAAELQAQLETYNAVQDETIAQTLAGLEPQEQMTTLLGNLEAGLESLTESYQEVYEAAKTSLEGQFDLFEQASLESKYSMDDFFAAMESQTQYWQNYSANLDLLASANADNAQLSAELMAYLNSGTAESVQMAAAFAQGYQDAAAQGSEALAEFIANANAAYEGTQSAMEGAAASIADSQVDIQQAFEDLVTSTEQAAEDLEMGDEFYQSAKDTIQGYVDGLDGGPIYSKMAEIAEQAIATFNAGVGVNSPSWKTEESARFTALGFFNEIQRQEREMRKNMEQFATAGVNAFAQKMDLDTPQVRQLVMPAESGGTAAAGGAMRGGNVVNIYPQSFNEATVDYLVRILDARLGAEA